MRDDFLLYPGCVIPSKMPFLEAAATFTLDALGVGNSPFPESSCCFEPVGLRSLGPDTWLAACGRLHSLAGGRRMLTLCDGCNLSLFEAGRLLSEDAPKEEVDRVLREFGRSVDHISDVVGLLELLHSRIDDLRANIQSPQALRLFIHPGCHCEHVSSEKGMSATEMLSDIIKAVGAEPLVADEGLCCGGGLTSVNDVLSKGIMNQSLDAMQETGADAIVTSCPFCFMQFDTIGRRLPVIHLAELCARALGWDVDTERYHRTRL